MYLLPLRTEFRKTEWHIRPVEYYLAAQLVEQYHYAKRVSSWCVYSFGLFLRGDPNCWGVTWWLPAPKLSVDKYAPGEYRTTLILSRMVVHPLVPRNGASFLLAGCVQEITRQGRFTLLLTYADTWQGHTGTVYKASNWHYEGMSQPTPIWHDTDGVLTSAYQNGRRLTVKEMQSKGHHHIGDYPKHIYSLRLKSKPQPQQLTLW